jgi:hypothetical protein
MNISRDILKVVVSIIMLAYVSKAVPVLPNKIEKLFENIIFKVSYVSVVLYLMTGELIASVSAGILLFAVMYLVKMAIREPFEDFTEADIEEIKNNEYYSYLDDQSKASDSVKDLMSNIAEKASDVQNFYVEKCGCKQ